MEESPVEGAVVEGGVPAEVEVGMAEEVRVKVQDYLSGVTVGMLVGEVGRRLALRHHWSDCQRFLNVGGRRVSLIVTEYWSQEGVATPAGSKSRWRGGAIR
jgi:hypothetical protein